METVLVVGATGNIGTSAVIGALNAGRNVLAIVRNANSAEKLFQNVGTREGITTVEADITSDTGTQSVVDQVKAGKLPHFEHVYACVGGAYLSTTLLELDTKTMRQQLNHSFEANFFAYRATIPYLLERNHANSTWTLCTGAQGEMGERAAPSITQGALFSMANVACRDNLDTNIRFNEVFLAFRVEVDSSAAETGAVKASDFAKNYQKLLDRPDIRSCRVIVARTEQVENIEYSRRPNFRRP